MHIFTWRTLRTLSVLLIAILPLFFGIHLAHGAPASGTPTPTPTFKVPAGYHIADANYKAPAGYPAAKGPLLAQNTCIQPPSQAAPNLRHDQLTDAQIAQYGMLPRKDVSNQQEWAYIVDHDTARACSVYTDGVMDGANKTTRAENEHSAPSHNWSGYEQWGNSAIGQSWNIAASQFYVAHVYGNAGIDGLVSDWVGMGGNGTGSNLVQTGTDSWDQYGNVHYDAWYEDVAQGPSQVIGGFPVASGQLFYAEATIDFVYIEDITNGHQFSTGFSALADPHLVDCINEWVTGFSQPQYDPEWFTQCEGEDGNGGWIYVGCNTCDAYTYIQMINNNVDATPSSPPSADGTFDVVWNNFNWG
jgi:hypothetical protein